MEEVKIIDGEEWVRKSPPHPPAPTPKADWKTEFDKFCDGDCARCRIFDDYRHDHRPCEIVWLHRCASVDAEKKEKYLAQIKKYLKALDAVHRVDSAHEN